MSVAKSPLPENTALVDARTLDGKGPLLLGGGLRCRGGEMHVVSWGVHSNRK